MAVKSVWQQLLRTAKPTGGIGGRLWWCLESIQGFLRHTRAFFPCCLARANIMCDFDEILWPDPDLRWDDENADEKLWPDPDLRWWEHGCWCWVTCTFALFGNIPLGNGVFYCAWTLPYMFCQCDISKIRFLAKTAYTVVFPNALM
jgi:hypothetical protein